MPTAGKVFVATERLSLPDISKALEGHRVEEEYTEGDLKLELLTEVANLTLTEDTLTGLYSFDYVAHHYHRGKVSPSPVTSAAARRAHTCPIRSRFS